MAAILSALQLGLLYAVMAMGIYTTFRILNVPDLTVDGSFVLGMAVAAVLTGSGHPYLALPAAALVGSLAGTATGLLQTKVGIHPILSGILVMTGLYTVNLATMGGKSNLSVAGKATIFTNMDKTVKEVMYQIYTLFHGGKASFSAEEKEVLLAKLQKINATYGISKLVLALLACFLIFLVLSVFYKTKLGLAIRATGDNEDMVRSSSVNANRMKCIGLAIGNACVALSGALLSQHQMFSDVNFGSGMVVIGLASVIIGETIFGKHSVTIGLLSATIGSVIYRIIIYFALKYNMFPAYALKLVSAVIVALALSIPAILAGLKQNKIRRGAREYAGTEERK